MRTSRLRRILKIMLAVQSGMATSVDALAKRVGASRRTIFRDIVMLGTAGYSIVFDQKTGRYVNKLAIAHQTQDLSLREAVMIIRMCEITRQSTAPGECDLVDDTIEKVLAIVPSRLRLKAEDILNGTMPGQASMALAESS